MKTKSRSLNPIAGFTLIEVLIGLSISVLVVGGAMRLLMTIIQRDALSAEHVRIISEGQKMADFLRTTTRLTSLQEMLLYPEDGPHNAVSYPLPPSGVPVQNQVVGSTGFVEWGKTLVIHAWPPDNPVEMRLTRFEPRDNDLTLEERLEQLSHVSATGSGQGTHNGANASTLVIARVQADFSVRTGVSGYNFYAASESLETNTHVGSVRLRPRENTITFRLSDKSPQSSGFHINIDRLSLSPAGLPVEAEGLFPPEYQSGASAFILERIGAGWSGERALRFPASAQGAELELSFFNDTWREERFQTRGAEFINSFAELRTDPGLTGHWLRPAGRELAWFAPFQTSGTGESTPLPAGIQYGGAAVRTILRGSLAGEHITAAGDGVRVTFRAGDEAGRGMHILHAFISEAENHLAPTHRINTASSARIHFGDPANPQNAVRISPGGQATSVPVDFPIDPDKSYVVSYLLGSTAQSGVEPGYPAWFQDANRNDSYILPADLPVPPNANDLGNNERVGLWNAVSGILGTAEINTTHFNEAIYISRIVDTTLEDPVLEKFDFEAEVPTGTALTFRVRSGSREDFSDAPAWANANTLTSPGNINLSESRYLQVQVRMVRDRVHDTIPRVRNFTLNWPGPERTLDFGGSFIRTPQGGIADILVNDTPPATAFRADILLTGEHIARSPVPGARDWRIHVETTPRNR
jgi:type II secretory pathway pseudopilin PulG